MSAGPMLPPVARPHCIWKQVQRPQPGRLESLSSLQRDSWAGFWAQTSSHLLQRSWVTISWQIRGVTGDRLTSTQHPVSMRGRWGPGL